MAMEGTEMDFDDSSDEEMDKQNEEFYTYGIDELRDARMKILDYSIERVQARHKAHTAELDVPFPDRRKVRHEWYKGLKVFPILIIEL